jgi:murein DD-endopeptidase MepM/ murein hydrolase activator NlpD
MIPTFGIARRARPEGAGGASSWRRAPWLLQARPAVLVLCLVLLVGLMTLTPGVAADGCPLPRELGAGTWFLASLSSVDLCDLLAPPAPMATATQTPAPSPTPDPPTPTATATRQRTATRPRSTPTPEAAVTLPREHVVAEGETLYGIARRYGVTPADILQWNEIDEPDALPIGMVLRLPPDEGAPAQEPAPTQTHSPTQEPSPTQGPLPTQEPAATQEPTEAPPDSLTACLPELEERVLDLPFEAIRIEAYRDVLYLIAGGQLYAMPTHALAEGDPLQPVLLLPPEGLVSGIPVQELVDLALDPTSGELVLLDKSGDLFAYQPAAGRWSVRMLVQDLPEVWLDPQYLTIAVLDGVVYGLDVDGARLWRMEPGAGRPEMVMEAAHLAWAVDLAAMDGALYLLNTSGGLTDLEGWPAHEEAALLDWPVDLNAAEGGLVASDADGRRIMIISDEGTLYVTLAVSGMQRLRSATLVGRTLYAVAGPRLYVLDLDAPAHACVAPVYDDRMLFHGQDLMRELPALRLPFVGGVLPDRPRSYPGARRLYRFGIHEGVDFYQGDAPNLVFGSPVAAIADGVVARIDHGFAEMTPDEYAVVMNEIYALHSTPAEWLDKLRGQQVWIEHVPGIVSRYAHLSSVAAELNVGDPVTAGEILGEVGVSGTSSGVYASEDGYHLHWELWLDGHYLGFGLSLRETMRLWQWLF